MKRHAEALCLAGLITSTAAGSFGQVAITEVMSGASKACAPFQGLDYFELTNYATNTVNLTGYVIHDDHDQIAPSMFDGLMLQPKQSAVFVRTKESGWDPDRFREWWGTNLPDGLEIRAFDNFGLNGDDGGDELWLRDPENNVVDVVFFPQATLGHSFISDPATGEFGTVSESGVDFAFNAALCNQDVGSPGRSTPALPLEIHAQPADQVLQGCGKVILAARAQALPRPRYQWFKDGVQVPGATDATLLMWDVGETHAFFVRINNGVEERISRTATISISTNPLPPIITSAPQSIEVFREQTAGFCVEARGYPCPNYQWQLDGQDLPGQTDRCADWHVPYDQAYGSHGISVRVWNSLGETNISIQLTVIPRPELRITEIMAWPTNDLFSGHRDWFELTNFSTNEVDLRGFRFGDAQSFRAANVITNPLLMKPGESVVFVDTMSPAAFRAWWGTDHLRPDLQIVTWFGFALDNRGDEIYFWNASARDPTNEALVSVSYAQATEGLTFDDRFRESNYDEYLGWSGFGPLLSTLFLGGAFSALSGDIGSPGYLTNPPPRLLSILRNGSETDVRARVIPGRAYRLWGSDTLAAWEELGLVLAEDFVANFLDGANPNAATRFYRVEELP